MSEDKVRELLDEYTRHTVGAVESTTGTEQYRHVQNMAKLKSQLLSLYRDQDEEIQRLLEQNDGLYQAVLMGGRKQKEQEKKLEEMRELIKNHDEYEGSPECYAIGGYLSQDENRGE